MENCLLNSHSIDDQTQEVHVMNRSKSAPMKKHTTTTRKMPVATRHGSTISAVVTLGIIFSSMASANLKFTEVPEQQLPEIRGKFIARDKVRYFKLEMTTQWTDHTSFDHGAGLSLTMDISDRDNPKASITIGGSLGDRDDSSPTIANPIPATDNIGGDISDYSGSRQWQSNPQ